MSSPAAPARRPASPSADFEAYVQHTGHFVENLGFVVWYYFRE